MKRDGKNKSNGKDGKAMEDENDEKNESKVKVWQSER